VNNLGTMLFRNVDGASVEPLSATITSPRRPDLPNAEMALSTQNAIELASFRQGMTAETSKEFSKGRAASVPAG